MLQPDRPPGSYLIMPLPLPLARSESPDPGVGSDVALVDAYGLHGVAVRDLSRRLLRSDPRAEEITQEVFLDMWRHPEKFDARRGSLRNFLLARTRGKSIDFIRSETARRRREERSAREACLDGFDVAEEVWDMMIAKQVKRGVAALPDDLRRPIELHYFEGHAYREVARVLGTPESTVKSRVRVGLGQLRSSLIEQGAAPIGA